jgi:hypothetical protein
MRRCRPISACQRPGVRKGPLRSPFAPHWPDLPLPKPFRGAILARNRRGSGECRFIGIILLLCKTVDGFFE